MKNALRFLSVILLLALALTSFSIKAFANDSIGTISAKAACLIEAQSGKVLYSKMADKRLPMASTTKIMTAIVALESGLPLETVISIPKEAVGVEGSSVYLDYGEKMSFESLIYCLLLSSANDASVAIALAVCGSVASFVELMNQKAISIGLTNTHFTNPHGLYDKEHYTTAAELCALMAYAMRNADFRRISACEKTVIPRENDGVRVLINHNKLLKTYSGTVSGKTGFTKMSGRCLVSCAERDGLSLIAATLDAPSDWADHSSLYDFGFSSYQRMKLCAIRLSIPVISGVKDSVIVSSEPLTHFTANDGAKVTSIIYAPRFVFADIQKGEALGKIIYIKNGKIIATSPLIAEESVARIKYKFNFFQWLAELFG